MCESGVGLDITIQDDGDFLAVACCEDVVEKGRFAGSEIA